MFVKVFQETPYHSDHLSYSFDGITYLHSPLNRLIRETFQFSEVSVNVIHSCIYGFLLQTFKLILNFLHNL
ncbi:hypothetical protein HMPREF1207_03713 [Paenibacillus sp. HGH0039]|nr:hypothetical protein HMPREF1207_03713 [Paenibacillus sp. HGH0039]